jgi:hypothetical protein
MKNKSLFRKVWNFVSPNGKNFARSGHAGADHTPLQSRGILVVTG